MSQQQDAASASTQRSDSKAGEEKSRVSVIEKSVTHLLVATKTLLETLTRWSKQTATEGDVSDVYVRLGYEFNIACRAFNSIGVETNDLGPVPDLLRGILEETLSGDPSQAHLDKYLPKIRDIIVNLLQGLKKKQQKLRQRHTRDSSTASQSADPALPGTANAYPSTGQDLPNRQSSRAAAPQRQESVDLPTFQNGSSVPPRSTSTAADSSISSRYNNEKATQEQTSRDEPSYAFASQPSLSFQEPRPAPAPPTFQRDGVQNNSLAERPQPPSAPDSGLLSPNQPRQGDALAALQRGGELERRASRRFSNYHIQKHLGPSSGVPVIPPSQNSPIPNRGREVRESMSAVRVRGSQAQTRVGSKKATYNSPTRQLPRDEKSAEDNTAASTSGPLYEMPAEARSVESPYDTTPDDKVRQSYMEADDTKRQPPIPPPQPPSQPASAPADVPATASFPLPGSDASSDRSKSVDVPVRRTSRKATAPSAQPDRPTSAKDLTLFLQYKTKIKKFVLADGYEELSIARLQLAFIEKFAWNTHSNGLDLPEIYIQDPVSGVRHELEDLADVKNHSVLALNVDAVEEVKKHVDDGMGGLKSILQDVRSAVTDQLSVLQRVSDKQQDANKEITRLANTPASIQAVQSPLPNGAATLPSSRSTTQANLAEVQSLRRDLAVMRQTYSTSIADMQTAMASLRDKASDIKTLASSQPPFPSAADTDGTSSNNGRAYVNSGRKQLNSTSETLMTRVEELQDTVEDLRKDVVTRGVRPLPRQLETVSRDISNSTTQLKKLQEFIKREKPTWTKIWKDELQVVCDDQNLLTYQEELCADLEADLEAAAQTFALVEEATKQQNLVNASAAQGADGAPITGPARSSSRTLNPAVDPAKAKDGVLGEVRALQPNHESRLEAIERAEKLRQRELESRQDGDFKKELSGFVDEGKLKKSGGFEEAERMRKVKDEMARKEVWERMNGGRSVGGPSPVSSPPPEVPQEASEADKAVAAAAVPQPLDVPEQRDSVVSATTPEIRFEDAQEAPFPPS